MLGSLDGSKHPWQPAHLPLPVHLSAATKRQWRGLQTQTGTTSEGDPHVIRDLTPPLSTKSPRPTPITCCSALCMVLITALLQRACAVLYSSCREGGKAGQDQGQFRAERRGGKVRARPIQVGWYASASSTCPCASQSTVYFKRRPTCK